MRESPNVTWGEHSQACVCRTCRIVVLLDRLDAVMDRGATSGAPSDGDGIPWLSREWHHPSYVELVRVLELMRSVGRAKQRQHMLGYFEAPYRLVDRRVRVRGPHGKLVVTDIRVRERIVPRWVRLERVRHGVAFVEAQFRGDPSLPDAFIKMAA